MDLTMYGLINEFPVVARRCRDRTRHAPWMTRRTTIGTLTLRDRAMRFNLSGDMIFYTVCYTESIARSTSGMSRIEGRSNHTAASDHGVLLHPQHERHSSVDLELFVDHVQMNLDGAFRDPELVGNLLVAEPARDSPGDLQLSGGEDLRHVASGFFPADKLFDRLTHRPLFEPLTTRVNLSHALNHQGGGHLLQDDTADAQPNRLDEIIVLQHRGQQDGARGDLVLLHLLQHSEPVHPRHAKVEHGHVGAVTDDRTHRLHAVDTGGDDPAIALPAKHVLQPRENDRMVIGEHETDHETRLSDGRRGTTISRRAPVSLESIINVPCNASTRSPSVTGASRPALRAR